MTILLVSGLGPTFKNSDYLCGTLFDRQSSADLSKNAFDGFDIYQLGFDYKGQCYPLLRPRRDCIPHLTTFTLENILRTGGVPYEILRTERIWRDEPIELHGCFDLVLLSTTYVWDWRTLNRLLDRLIVLAGDAPLFLGGQFSNLKFERIMAARPEVDGIVRGDGERAIPQIVDAIFRSGKLENVDNLIYRENGAIRANTLRNIDLDSECVTELYGEFPVIPYESMRGCPFSCKFCSFPAASPIWRYKSAETIARDWRRYRERNGARFIKAMDSTFTIPPKRLNRLLEVLPRVGVDWEGYSRANVIKDAALLDHLAEAHCRFLSIGFESMSPTSLAAMDKRVSADQNRRAFELLKNGPVGYRCSFMTGYPGETPADFALTRSFLVDQYSGHYMLSVFSLSDEQMPVWAEAARYQIEILDEDDVDYSWRHSGMDAVTAIALYHDTLDAVRARNNNAVLMLWQADYQHWLMPHLPPRANLEIEKTIERIAFLALDVPNRETRRSLLARYLSQLAGHDVVVDPQKNFVQGILLEA